MGSSPNPLRLLAGLAVLATSATMPMAWGQEAQSSETRVVRAYFDDPLVAANAVISLEALESEYEKGYIVLRATEADIEAVRRAGMRVVDDDDYLSVALPSELPTKVVQGTISGFPCYRTVEETYASAQAIVDTYPELATWTVAGKSWKKERNASNGYDLMVLRLTNSATSGTKPALFITTAVHAREYATAELSTRFAEGLAESYETDADVRWLLDHQEVHIMLQANPDGRKRAEQGLWWRKNYNTNHCPDTTPGVDLNRNFPFKWGVTGSSTDQCSNVYRGSSAGSEPETQAIEDRLTTLFPDARGPEDDDPAPADKSGLFLDIHSHGRLILWPWGHTHDIPPNGAALQTLGRKLAFFNNHTPKQSIGLYPTSGTTADHAYGALGVAGFIYELGTQFFETCSYFNDTLLEDNLESLLYAFKATRTPYVIPSGPDVLGATLGGGASTTGVTAGTTVTLSGTFDDTRYRNNNGTEGSQNIAAGEYYVDTPPWATDATATAMAAADGTFDSTSEAATASVDTTGWTAGRHTLFVRAKDADDNWGAVSAVFLFIGAAPPAVPAAPTLTVGTEQLAASWTEPAGNGSPVTSYRLRYKPANRHFDWSTVDAGTAREFAITNLKGNRLVDVQVRAVNAIGSSAWSNAATASPDPNRAPEPVGTLADLTLQVVSGPSSVTVVDAFNDPEGDTLVYDASSSSPLVASATASGSEVIVTPVAGGMARITVTATDVGGSNTAAQQQIAVTVLGVPSVSISTERLTVNEGANEPYTVVLGAQPTGPVTVAARPPSGTDVSVLPDSLEFTALTWDTAQTVTVFAAEDGDTDSDAAVTVSHEVSGANYDSVMARSVEVTIVENDTPTLSVEDAEASEGSGAMTFGVELSLASSSEVTVDYATSDHSGSNAATSGSDYTATAGTLTFAAGSAQAHEIRVPVLDDDDDESEQERFTFTLASAANAVLAGGGSTLAARGTILDNDHPEVEVTFGASSYEAEEGSSVEVTVHLDRDPERMVEVPLEATHHGGATTADYTGIPSFVTFSSGKTEEAITVRATSDSDDDDGEAVVLRFGSLPARVTGSGATTVAIMDVDDGSDGLGGGGGGGGAPPPPDGDDDGDNQPPPPPLPEVSVVAAEASETRGAVVFDVRLSAASGSAVTVGYFTADGAGAAAARAASDYTATSGSLTFPAGSTAVRQVRVPVIDDRLYEPESETFTLTLRKPANATLAGGGSVLQVIGTIHDDDDGPPMAAFELSGAACESGLCRAVAGEPVRFRDASLGKALFRRWEFGDGESSQARGPEHAWLEPGFYDVILWVSDGERESRTSRKFLVEASEPAGSCVADAETLCLQDSRYAVRVDWWTAAGEGGAGSVVHEGTNDSGLFTFFSRENWEVLIKVLDGCALNRHVWVYGASTTDLGYSIRVTDTVTGKVKAYRNEPGHQAPAITDGVAFPEGCSR